MKLDHVAIATPDHRSVLLALTGDLGGLVIGGGTPPRSGFRAMQVRLGRGEQGMTVEVLEPHEPEHDDFLARFVERNGGGVHHLTFKTADIVGERERLRGLGIETVGVDLTGVWKEMFIHPRDAHGTVIQIAQSVWEPLPMREWLAGLPDTLQIWEGREPWWDGTAIAGDPASPATLERVVIATPDPDAVVAFYRDILGGVADDHAVRWEGGEVLLERASGRPRVDRLEISGSGMEVAGVRFVGI